MSTPNGAGTWRPKGLVVVLDTSVLVRAWLSPAMKPNPSRRAMLLAGSAYDSFTRPAILEEVEAVLTRPHFGATSQQVRLLMDIFLPASRQVFPEALPPAEAAAVGGDLGDVPVLTTAYAVAAAGQEVVEVLATARTDGGWFLGWENTRHFTPGRNVYGWQFTTAHLFLRHLDQRSRADV